MIRERRGKAGKPGVAEVVGHYVGELSAAFGGGDDEAVEVGEETVAEGTDYETVAKIEGEGDFSEVGDWSVCEEELG